MVVETPLESPTGRNTVRKRKTFDYCSNFYPGVLQKIRFVQRKMVDSFSNAIPVPTIFFFFVKMQSTCLYFRRQKPTLFLDACRDFVTGII